MLEYPLQQVRVLPIIAGAYAISAFSKWLSENYADFKSSEMKSTYSSCLSMLSLSNAVPLFVDTRPAKLLADMNKEVHSVSCVGKPLAAWFTRDAIQECREACGGHGYAGLNRLGQLRDENEYACALCRCFWC